ncbi:MAG TPA: protocatechuate 3,4-dioxygenase subunit alpha [Caulobacteraceae bacterium]|nr:protocatechuate 3,4-dioxygenase subunit alpha [Caulobacteraceae bacterium]
MSEPLKQTPWQTLGPFFHYALPWAGGADLVAGAEGLGARTDLIPEGHDLLARSEHGPRAGGEPIEIVGRVSDADGHPLSDALVEIWQANPEGRYASDADPRRELPIDPGFVGFGRSATGPDGSFRFRTLKPGRVPGPGNSLQAPHIAVSVMGRGILKRLVTRLYFDGEPTNSEDTILALAPDARRGTLMARFEGGVWRFDIRLQGDDETVFFEF